MGFFVWDISGGCYNHQCSTLDEVYEEVGRWICDPAVAEKLTRKDDWIRSNRIRYLGKIVKALQS